MARNFKMPNKKTTIIVSIIIAILAIIAVTGTVVFLKDRGSTEAADLGNEQVSREETRTNVDTPNEQASQGQTAEENGEVAGNQDGQNDGTVVNDGATTTNAGTTTTTGTVAGTRNNGTTATTDNIQDATISRTETVEIAERQISEGHYVGWTPMGVNAVLASANINAKPDDIEVTKTGNETAKQGDEVTYEITVTNKEDRKLENVEVKDKLDDTILDVTTVKYIDNDGTLNGNVITWNIDLEAGQTVKITFKATVKTNVAEGTILKNSVVANGKEIEKPVETKIEKAKINIPVEKAWANMDSDAAKANAVTGIKVTIEGTNKEVTLNASNEWAAEFTELDKYDAQGNEIEYTLSEAGANANDQTKLGYYTQAKATGEDGKVTFTNTFDPSKVQSETINIPVKKVWENMGSAAAQANAVSGIKVTIEGREETKTLNATNGWEETFTKLPKYDANGNEINYVLKEEAANADDQTKLAYYNQDKQEVDGKVTFTNTFDPSKVKETINIPVEKAWENMGSDAAKANKVSAIKVTIDGVENKEVTLNASNGWKDTFTNLPKYDAQGNKIEYTLSEAAENADDQTKLAYYNQDKQEVDGKVKFINTFDPTKVKETIDIPVEKQWVNIGMEAAKDYKVNAIKVTIDGVENKEVTLNASNEWKDTFTNLPKYDADGNKIVYTLTETATNENDQTILNQYYTPDQEQQTENGKITFVNTFEPSKVTETTSISGTKTWDDAENVDGNRPTEIKVDLMRKMANGTQTRVEGQETKTVTAENSWNYEFNGLAKYDAATGEEIVYTVVETGVAGCTPTYIVNENDATIINISNRRDVNHLEATKEITGVKPVESETGRFVEVNPEEYYVTEGESIKYKIEITNNGNTDLTDIVVRDDKKVTLEEITVPDEMNKENVALKEYGAKENLTENLTGILKKGEKITLYVILKVEKNLIVDVDTLTNNVVASAKNTPEDPGKDTIEVAKIPSATIEKTSVSVNDADITSETKLKKDDIVTYELKVTNTGNTTLEHVNITDDRKVSYNGKIYNAGEKLLGEEGITLSAVPGENTYAIRVTYQVTQDDLDEQNEQKTLINLAYVTGKNEENQDIIYDQDDDSLEEIEAKANITDKTKSIKVNGKNATTGTTVNIGDEITYTITVKNEGTAKAREVTIEDYVPEGTRFVSTTRTPELVETREDGKEWRTWKVDVPVGETASIAFTVKVTNAALGKTIDNIAMVNKDNTNEITNNTQKAINIYEVESIGQGQKAVVVIDMSLSMASAVNPDINSDTMAYTYETTRWYYLKTALDKFIDEFLANGKNEIAIVGFNSEARTLISTYTSNKAQAKGSYANVFTQTHFDNLVAAAKYGEDIFNKQKDGSFATSLSGREGRYVIDVDALTYLGEGRWHKDASKNGVRVRAGEMIAGATETTPCRLASGTNIASGLKAANDILGNGKTTNTSVILMTDGEDTKSTTISNEAEKIHNRKAADLYTIAFTNDAKTLTSKVGTDNITKAFSATDSGKLYAAFEEIADKITNLPKVEKITDQTGKVDLSSYANQNIGNVVIFKGSVNNGANTLKTYTGDQFKALLKNGQFDLAAFINSNEIKDKITENDMINIEIVVNK